MPTFRRLEDIEAWRLARELAREVYAVSGRPPFDRDFALRDQVRRACVSVAANIAEGYGRGGSQEFLQFLAVAKGSVSEVRSHLYLALDQGYVTEDEFAGLNREAESVGRLVGGLMGYLRRSSVRGLRHRRETDDPGPGDPAP